MTMSMSNFDPDLFLSTSLDSKLDTVRPAIPPREYTAVIDDVIPRMTRSDDGTEYLIFDVLWAIDDQALKDATGRSKITSRQSLFLDMTPSGSIDAGKGKNTQLGRLREAVGQNTPGPWAPSMLKGAVARVKVINDTNKKTGDIFDKVVSVAKL